MEKDNRVTEMMLTYKDKPVVIVSNPDGMSKDEALVKVFEGFFKALARAEHEEEMDADA